MNGTGELEQLYREHAGQLLGSLMRTFRDLDLCEEVLHEAVVVALQRWPAEGRPRQPAAWLLTVARRLGLDRVRREAKRAGKTAEAARRALADRAFDPVEDLPDTAQLSDDALALLLLCCHPALAPEAQVALTLRTAAGLTTGEIARAFLVEEATMAQRLVRAKRKIRLAGIPFGTPDGVALAERLHAVLQVLYLVFNEGYAATDGPVVVRADLATEAIRLARAVRAARPDDGDVLALLGLMLLHDARRPARTTPEGDLVLLADQDRARWDRQRIDEGLALVDAAFARPPIGAYHVEAAIAALHGRAPAWDATDWPQIAALYGVLARAAPNPVVTLNRAIAVAMADGPGAGLVLLEPLLTDAGLARSHLLHAARADLLVRLGRRDEAAAAYRAALARVATVPERRFLEQRLAGVTGA